MFIYANIQPTGKVLPYVYQLVHKETGEFYIGFRYVNVKLNRTSHEDLPQYKTSSKKVKPVFDQFDWGIIAEFEDRDAAYTYEQQLIYENWSNPLILNQRCHHTGKILQLYTPAIRKKISDSLKGKPKPESFCKKLSTAMKGNTHSKGTTWSEERRSKMYSIMHSKEYYQKQSASSAGRQHSEKTKQKISNGNTGKVRTAEYKEGCKNRALGNTYGLGNKGPSGNICSREHVAKRITAYKKTCLIRKENQDPSAPKRKYNQSPEKKALRIERYKESRAVNSLNKKQ